MFRAPESQTTVSLLTTCVEGCWIQARCRDPSVCQSNRGAHARVSESERVNERESEREREREPFWLKCCTLCLGAGAALFHRGGGAGGLAWTVTPGEPFRFPSALLESHVRSRVLKWPFCPFRAAGPLTAAPFGGGPPVGEKAILLDGGTRGQLPGATQLGE